MFTRWVISGTVGFLLTIATSLRASTNEVLLPGAGDFEVRVGGTGFSKKEFGRSAFNLSGNVGYFFSRFFEVSLRQELSYDSDVSDHWTGGTHGGFDLNVPLGRLEPYVGMSIGHLYGNSALNDLWEFDPGLGLKWYVQSHTFMYAEAAYSVLFTNFDNLGDGFDNGIFKFSLGIGFNF